MPSFHSSIRELDVDLQGIILIEEDRLWSHVVSESVSQNPTKPSHFAILHRPFRKATAFVHSSKPQTAAVFANPQMKSRASLKQEAVKLEAEEERTSTLRSARIMRGKLQDFSFAASSSGKIEGSPLAGMFLLSRHLGLIFTCGQILRRVLQRSVKDLLLR
jgi:hypothetical protein